MDSNDENLVNTKTLIELNESTNSLAHKEESPKLDLTSSTAMGARITKSQENGSGVLGEENGSVDGGSGVGGGGGGVGDGVIDLGVLSTKEGVGVEEEGSVVDGSEMEKGVTEIDENMNGASTGVNANGDSETKLSGDVSSSISQRTRNKIVMGEDDGIAVEDGHNGSISADEADDEHGFRVGDFVWGKVKSHPWWPGRIYDPSDASEFALRYKYEGRHLVGYFGDRTFAWCDHSQLKSFEENFEEMSKQSTLKTFVSAVEEAENEIGRLVKIQTTCSCVREGQSSLPLVVNAGVKEGVCAPEYGISVYTLDQLKPSEMLADIRRLATFDSVANTLELTVLTSRLSAFHHAKFGYSLPIQCEPIRIEGLVDYQGVLPGASFPGPDDEDLLMGPEDQPLGQNEPVTPLCMSQKRRKVKSIVELLGCDTKDELVGNMDRAERETPKLENSVVKSKKRRRKASDEDQSIMQGGGDVLSKDEEQSGNSVPKSSRKRRKTVDESQSHVADNLMITRSSSRKKGGSAGSTTSEKKTSGGIEDGGKAKDKKKTKTVPHVTVSGGSMVEQGYERISPREKKLSKYLSPPYTNLLQRQRSSCSQTRSEAEGLVFSDVAKMGERVTKAAGKLTGSPPLVKCSAETFRKSSKVSDPKNKKIDSSDHNTSKQEPSSEVNDHMKCVGSLDSVLHEIRSAALDVVYPLESPSFDSVRGFLSSYRSSNYKNGSTYTSYKKVLTADRQRKRKGNSSVDEHGPDQKVLNEVDQQTPNLKSMKRKSARKSEQKLELKADNEVVPSLSAALVIAFPAGFSLPTKKDIIEMCSKFGDVDETNTEVVLEPLTAKIVFVQSSAAEAAMAGMQKSVPFGSAEVSYRIEHLAAATSKGKKVNVQNKKKIKSTETRGAAVESPDKHPAVSPTPDDSLAVIFIKQKLLDLQSMLSQTDGKMSREMKANLEHEAKELLKKVKMMAASSSPS